MFFPNTNTKRFFIVITNVDIMTKGAKAHIRTSSTKWKVQKITLLSWNLLKPRKNNS